MTDQRRFGPKTADHFANKMADAVDAPAAEPTPTNGVDLGDLDIQDGLPLSIWFKPGSEENGPACLNLQFVGGPKAYLRLWLDSRETEWGWSLHESSVCLFRLPPERGGERA